MSAPSTRAVQASVHTMLGDLAPALRRVGSLLVAEPETFLRLSITEVAARAETSPGTVTRFCRLVGYSGYVDLRLALARELGHGVDEPTWIPQMGRAFQADDTATQVLATLLNAHTLSLKTTASVIDLAAATQVASRIKSARQVGIIGLGGSASIARELEARLLRVGISCRAWADMHTGLVSAALMDDACVALAFSNSGRTPEVLHMVEVAASVGVFTVGVSASSETPLARLADSHLVAASPEGSLQPDDMSARHSQLFVADLLYLLTLQQDFSGTAARLQVTADVLGQRFGSKKPQESKLARGMR